MGHPYAKKGQNPKLGGGGSMWLRSHFRSQSPFQRGWISMASLKRDPHKQRWELCPWEIFREVGVRPWRLKEISMGGETAIDVAAWTLAHSQAQERVPCPGPLGRQWWLRRRIVCIICVCVCMGWCSGEHMVREVFGGQDFRSLRN